MDERDEYPMAETSFRTVDPIGGGAMDLATQIFDNLNVANEAARVHIRLGRQQAFEEVKRIAGTWAARKPADQVVQEIIELCTRELK